MEDVVLHHILLLLPLLLLGRAASCWRLGGWGSPEDFFELRAMGFTGQGVKVWATGQCGL